MTINPINKILEQIDASAAPTLKVIRNPASKLTAVPNKIQFMLPVSKYRLMGVKQNLTLTND